MLLREIAPFVFGQRHLVWLTDEVSDNRSPRFAIVGGRRSRAATGSHSFHEHGARVSLLAAFGLSRFDDRRQGAVTNEG